MIRHYFRLMLPWLALGLAVTGCKVGPTYQRPCAELTETWKDPHDKLDSRINQGDMDTLQWWKLFNDPLLNQLIGYAAHQNLNVQIAAYRILEARATSRMKSADLLPEVRGKGYYVDELLSFATLDVGLLSFLPPTLKIGREQEIFDFEFDVSWEVDLFGHTSLEIAALMADTQSLQDHQRDILVTLYGDVARYYFEVRTLQELYSIVSNSLESQSSTATVVASRFEAGLSTYFDSVRANAQVATTRARLPVLETQLVRSMHRLAVLLGYQPNALRELLAVKVPLPELPLDIPIGIPSELLLRRPDIRQAERELAASTERIGVAVAEFFPRLSFTGQGGWNSNFLNALTLGTSQMWQVNPVVTLPIFNAGRLKANLRAQNARQKQALLHYWDVVLNSLEEVENSLVSFSLELVHNRDLKEAAENHKQANDLALDLHLHGLTDFLSVLEAQRTWLLAMEDYMQSLRSLFEDLVVLYRALGGGWQVDPFQPAEEGCLPALCAPEMDSQAYSISTPEISTPENSTEECIYD